MADLKKTIDYLENEVVLLNQTIASEARHVENLEYRLKNQIDLVKLYHAKLEGPCPKCDDSGDFTWEDYGHGAPTTVHEPCECKAGWRIRCTAAETREKLMLDKFARLCEALGLSGYCCSEIQDQAISRAILLIEQTEESTCPCLALEESRALKDKALEKLALIRQTFWCRIRLNKSVKELWKRSGGKDQFLILSEGVVDEIQKLEQTLAELLSPEFPEVDDSLEGRR